MENSELNGGLQKLSKTVLLYALSLTCEKEQTKNMLLETCLKTLDNENRFACTTDFQSWVFDVVRSLVLNDYCRLTKKDILPFEEQYKIELAGQVEQFYDLSQIAKAVDLLSQSDGFLFIHFLQGYKYDEMAKLFHLPLEMIKNRLIVIRGQVAENLKNLE